jgi:hypothetical protein
VVGGEWGQGVGSAATLLSKKKAAGNNAVDWRKESGIGGSARKSRIGEQR